MEALKIKPDDPKRVRLLKIIASKWQEDIFNLSPDEINALVMKGKYDIFDPEKIRKLINRINRVKRHNVKVVQTAFDFEAKPKKKKKKKSSSTKSKSKSNGKLEQSATNRKTRKRSGSSIGRKRGKKGRKLQLGNKRKVQKPKR